MNAFNATAEDIGSNNSTTMTTVETITTLVNRSIPATTTAATNVTQLLSTEVSANLSLPMAAMNESLIESGKNSVNNSRLPLNNTIFVKHLEHHDSSSFFLETVIFPLILVGVLCLIVGIALYAIKKNRLEKLRHHLMPVYNFDPSEDGEDWETELLDDNLAKTQASYANVPSTATLKLDTGLTGGLNVKNASGLGTKSSNNNASRRSPTPSSGLLSSRSASNILYTNEKPIV
ncbi:hypothetical protein B4U79_12848 [Dinothrombium tinctorium]|uniref:Uncharacterized protein n=1 Tax=Dinothrombium tinctorium TaxID=1965070 RepID=A0A443QPS1_9ACAR|nr:hypothetical protein B4U79_12848 [Dinothrombium tinctorium]